MSFIDDFIKSIQNSGGQVANELTNGVNAFGKVVGGQPLVPSMPGSPTLSDAFNTANEQLAGNMIPGGDVLAGQATPESLGNTALFGLTLGLGGAKSPEDVIKKSEVDEGALGTSLKRDMRYKQGNPEYKVNPNPERATYSTVAPETSVTKTKTTGANPAPTQATQEQPETPTYTPIVRGEKEIGKPGAIHINTDGSIDTAQKQTNAQKAVDNIPGTTATDKFNNLNNRMTEISNQIDSYNKANPITIPESAIKSKILDQVKPYIAPRGMQPAEAQINGFITEEQANIIADDTIRQLKKGAGIEAITPNTQYDIPIGDVFNMKTSFNKIYGGLLDKRYSGGNLTTGQQVQLAARDGLDQAISEYQPKIKDLTLEQSGLYNSQGQLAKMANSEYQESLKPKPNMFEKVMGNVKSNPAGYLALGGLGLMGGPGLLSAGEIAGGKLINLAGQAINSLEQGKNQSANEGGPKVENQQVLQLPQSSVHSYQSVPQSLDNVNTKEQLAKPSDILGTDGLPLLPSQEQYNSQVSKITGEMKQLESLGMTFTQQYRNDAEKLTKLNAQNPKDKSSLYGTWEADNNKLVNMRNVSSLFSQVEPNFFNNFKSYQDFQKNTDPKYAALRGAMANLAQTNPNAVNNLFSNTSVDAAQSDLEQGMKGVAFDYYNEVNGFTGYSGQSGQPTREPTGQPKGQFNGATQANPQGLPAYTAPAYGMPF